MRETKIFPMSYTLKKMKCKLYFLDFPNSWKIKLYEINPNIRKEFPLYTRNLANIFNDFAENIVNLSAIRYDTDNAKWLTSTSEIKVDEVFMFIKIWVHNQYVKSDDEGVSKRAKDLIDKMDITELKKGLSEEAVELISENGEVLDNSVYKVFPNVIVNKLMAENVLINGKSLTFNKLSNNKLMTNILYYKEYPYAVEAEFSVQTTPPKRKHHLVVHFKIRRFAHQSKNKPYLEQKINAHIDIGNNRFKLISIRYDSKSKTVQWDNLSKECYEFFGNTLPNAKDVLENIEKYNKKKSDVKIFLPYKDGSKFAFQHEVGKGLPFKDKAVFYEILGEKLNDVLEINSPINSIGSVHIKEEEDVNNRVNRLFEIVGSKEVNIEIYYSRADLNLVEPLKNQIITLFGENSLKISEIPIGEISNAMNGKTLKDFNGKVYSVSKSLEKATVPTGAIIILPNDFDEDIDPKKAIRTGFVNSNRLTQFVTPKKIEEEIMENDDDDIKKQKKDMFNNRMKVTVGDLFRQFGYTKPIINRTIKIRPKCLALNVLTGLEPKSDRPNKFNRAKYLPVYLTLDSETGKVFVECNELLVGKVPYHKALLEFSKISRKPDFVTKCKNSTYGSVKQKIISYNNLYKNEDAVLFVDANGNIRTEIFTGISDSSINKYQYKKPYVSKEINIGSKSNEYMVNLNDSKLRIVRVRSGEEVPEYYTDKKADKDEHKSATGIFKYEDIFYDLAKRKNDKTYRSSCKNSRFNNPKKNFNEHQLMEIFPMHLQNDDNVEEWVKFTHLLRESSLQYSETTNMPVPLHLLSLIKEYFVLN